MSDQNKIYKQLIIQDRRNGTEIFTSKPYEFISLYEDVEEQIIATDEIFSIATCLLKNTDETIDPDIAANLKEAYNNDNIDAVMLIEHVKDWILNGKYKYYSPVNPATNSEAVSDITFYTDLVRT